MTSKRAKRALLLVAVTVVASSVAATTAVATPIASKFTLAGHFGWEVNQTTGAAICTIASTNVCQPGKESQEPGGYSYLEGIAVDNDQASTDFGDILIADTNNDRIQELTPTGEFVLMFGWNVNKTKTEKGAPQAERNVCTAAEVKGGAKCQAGEPGTGLAGQLSQPSSLAVDSTTGNVYVLDRAYHRVDEFTEAGEFVLTIGGEVNETQDKKQGATEAEKNLCTAASLETCKAGVASAVGSAARGAFNTYLLPAGNLLAIGGPDDLLYVGDERRVQEFEASGAWTGEVPLTSISSTPSSYVSSLAVDPAGNLYIAYNIGELQGGSANYVTQPTNVIHEFHQNEDAQFAEFKVPARDVGKLADDGLVIGGLALDPNGRLGIFAYERYPGTFTQEEHYESFGELYSASGTAISEFGLASGEVPAVAAKFGIAFSASDELYLTAGTGAAQEVEAYAPALFPEVITCPAEEVAATSAKLCGAINANGLSTRGFFDYGPPTGARTPVAFEGQGEAFAPVGWLLTGLEPNETYGYQALAEAEAAGEEVTGHGEEVKFHTSTPPVQISGEPSASFVEEQSAVLNASLNPEHAPTDYHFEYEACDSEGDCGALQSTPSEESSQYGVIGAKQEVVGLASQTTYRFWLVANNEHEEAGRKQGGAATGVEGTFTTGAGPVVEVSTGAASAITATSAIVSGTVNGDGQPATYMFEVGRYAGTRTRYGVVLSGSTGAGVTPVQESLALTGLQPGSTYAYRLAIKSGYVPGESHTLYGQPALFTTAGLPTALFAPPVLSQLAVPSIAFPAAVAGSAKPTAKRSTNARRLAKALKLCGRKAKKRRAACERRARKQDEKAK